MKRLFILFILVLLTLNVIFPQNRRVSAEDSYMRVITEDTPFFAYYTDLEPLFYLPYTYYVKVIGYENGYSHVECYGKNSIKIDGYVPTDLLYDDDLSVTNPYANIKIYTLTPSVIYSDSKLSTPMQYVFPSRQLDFYGTLPSEQGNLYFVGYNGKLGYVKESDIQPFTLQNHPNELTFLQTDVEIEIPETEPEPDQEQPATTDNTTLKILIIASLSIAGIIGFFVATKKRTESNYTTNRYYDENEYE
ncbi:MAG: hypothetical protein IKA12_03390 [Clostridia bacterium]|nr:hypothetical protein [Clostridia bacterium]